MLSCKRLQNKPFVSKPCQIMNLLTFFGDHVPWCHKALFSRKTFVHGIYSCTIPFLAYREVTSCASHFIQRNKYFSAGVSILIQKWYSCPTPPPKMRFLPLFATHGFWLLFCPFYLNSSLFCIYFILLLPIFSFFSPFFPFTFSTFFLLLFIYFPPSDIGWYFSTL